MYTASIRAFNSEDKLMDSMYNLLDRFHWALYHSEKVS